MTEYEAIAQIQLLCKLSLNDVRGLQQCNQAQLQFIVQSYIDDQVVPSLSVWQQIGDILLKVPQYTSIATSIISVVTALIAL